MSQDSQGAINSLRTGQLTYTYSNIKRDKNLSLLRNMQQRSGAHSAP